MSDARNDAQAPYLGAILAGGRSRRFGAPKALAEVGGERIVERVRDAVQKVVPDVVLIANEPRLFAGLDLPVRADRATGAGPLGGIYTALRWAREEGRPGALCVACDMPFLSPALLRRLLECAERTGADIMAPESEKPQPVEPLCAVYSVGCLPEIEQRLANDEFALKDLVMAVRLQPLSLAEVNGYGDPNILFFNVNTPDQYRAARRIAAEEIEDANR